jgi:putative ABC transport system permease protein
MQKYILYFRQAWNLLRQEKLFSSIYIAGTGLSIAAVMVLSIVYYFRTGNIYPETKRDRMLIVKSCTEDYGGGASTSGSLSLPFIEACFQSLESAEAVAAISYAHNKGSVQADGGRQKWPVRVQRVDTAYWQVFDFHFVDGKPFTGADFRAGIHTAVIAESLAQRLFGTVEATGRYVNLNLRPFRVCGVVRDVSFVTEHTYAQLWTPYTVDDSYKLMGDGGVIGTMAAYILAPSVRDVGRVREEALANVRRYAGQLDGIEINLHGQPDRQWQTIFRFWADSGPDFGQIAMQYGGLFLILLLVPAISLSGMADSRMERRMAEMGIRRAFGAPKGVLMRQVIAENLFFTLTGGLCGLALSCLLVVSCRDWIMTLGHGVAVLPGRAEMMFMPSMLFNLPLFGATLAVCFLLNLFSSLLPAWKASRRAIIRSLNT